MITGDTDIDHDQVKSYGSGSEIDRVYFLTFVPVIMSHKVYPTPPPSASWLNPKHDKGLDIPVLSAFLTLGIAFYFPLDFCVLWRQNNCGDSWQLLGIHVGLI